MNHYDYLIVGAGLYGAVFAQQAKKAGKTCLVIDKRGHIAGNIYTEEVEGIQVHRYGAHIFHTSSKAVWQYVNQFTEFNRYTNSPVANYHGEIYNLPFNMNTFNKMWGVVTPAEAKAKIEEQKREAGITEPKNLEEQAISLVGTDIYEKLIKGYTGKQWGRPCTELPAFIIKRLPVRFTYDNNYFNALYQGIPDGGYTAMVEKMLEGIEVRLNVDYLADRENLNALADKVVYTGPVDAYFGYRLGALQYRSVRFETEVLDTDNYQGNAVVNYTRQAVGPPLHRTAGFHHQTPAGPLYLRQQLFQRAVSGHPRWRLYRHGGKDAGGHRGAAECGLSGRPGEPERTGRQGGLHRPGGCLLWLPAGGPAVPQRPL